jgi:putative endonuclease
MQHAQITQARRRAAEHNGRLAERDVAAFFQARGFTILAERLRTGVGEIDLVVADDTQLIFIEVKARRTMFDALHAISPRQQARLLGAASVALATTPGWAREKTSFDVALVTASGITHLSDAIRYN